VRAHAVAPIGYDVDPKKVMTKLAMIPTMRRSKRLGPETNGQ